MKHNHPSTPACSSADPNVQAARQAKFDSADIDAAEKTALAQALSDSPIFALLDTAGHTSSCIKRIRSGHSLGCSCKNLPQPLDDAATIIGLAIRFAQMGWARQIPIPSGIVTGLASQVDAGNAAAILVWQWLARRGQVLVRSDVRPALHVVKERT